MKPAIKLLALSALIVTSFYAHASYPEKIQTKENITKKLNLEITYIGNEGVLIKAGMKQVIVDGLHREYLGYSSLPQEQLDKIVTAQDPFGHVNLLLVTHVHADHFDARSVGLFLEHSPEAVLVSPQQVDDNLRMNFIDYDKIKAQIKPVTPLWKEKIELTVAGIKLEVLGLQHSGPMKLTQNLGYIVNLGGKKLLHVGDANMAVENFERFKLNEENIDVAFIPYWYLVDNKGQTVVNDQIKARQIIAVHVPPAGEQTILKKIKESYPDAELFTRLMEKKMY